jgi:malic enzyme
MERAYLDQTHHRQIDLVVVSDAEAILGIGGKPLILKQALVLG